jgi:tetratricopeptide (TPR) repeat protein
MVAPNKALIHKFKILTYTTHKTIRFMGTCSLLFIINYAYSQKSHTNEECITVIDYCTMQINKNPEKNFEYYKPKAEAYYLMKNLPKALENYNLYIQFKKDNSNAYYNRGIVKQELSDVIGSIKDFSTALKYADANNQWSIFFARGFSFFILNKYKEALDDFNNSLKCNRKNAETYNNIALIYIQEKKYNLAFAQINLAIQIDSANIDYINNKGYILTLLGEYKDALVELNKALSISYDNGYTNNYMGFLLYKKGNIIEACKYFEKAKSKKISPLVPNLNCND